MYKTYFLFIFDNIKKYSKKSTVNFIFKKIFQNEKYIFVFSMRMHGLQVNCHWAFHVNSIVNKYYSMQ